DLTMLEQADAIRRREVSPVDLVEHYLDRIERHNETVGAFVHIAPDQARAAAKDAESAVTSGADLPPLHGVPTGIKDLYLTADIQRDTRPVRPRSDRPDRPRRGCPAGRDGGTVAAGLDLAGAAEHRHVPRRLRRRAEGHAHRALHHPGSARRRGAPGLRLGLR